MKKLILTCLAGVGTFLAYWFNPAEVKRRRVAKYRKRLGKIKSEIIKARKENNEELVNKLLAERQQVLDEIRALGV